MKILRQSTEQRIIAGPFLDSSDGDTEMTALTIQKADVHLVWANAPADTSSSNQSEDQVLDTGAPHRYGGNYAIWLSADDTETAEMVRVYIHKAGCLPVWEDYRIVPASVYDALADGDPWTEAALVNAPTGASATFAIAQPATLGALVSQPLQAYRYCGFSWTIPFSVSQAGGTLKFCATSMSDRTTVLWSLDSTHFTIAGNGLSAVLADTDAYTTNTGTFAWFIHNLTTDRRAAEGMLEIADGPNVTA